MASQITHVVYGKKIFDRIESDLDWAEFIVGTTLPDIRYLAKVDRDKFHYFKTSEDSIPTDSSFNSGLYIHSLVDEKREALITSEGIYNYVSSDWAGVLALKLVEDEVLYSKYKGWAELIKIFDEYCKDEFRLIRDKEVVFRWHKFLQDYFRKKPTEEIWHKAIVLITSDESTAKKVIEETSKIKRNRRVMNIIRKTYKSI